MCYRRRSRDEHLANDGAPKRILALDGGGLRGILTLGLLEKIESILRERHGGDPEFRLCHYFDLIAGTSTGAIIAAGLAVGMSVAELLAKYRALGQSVFEKSRFRKGYLRAKYDAERLIAELQRVFGRETTLGSETVQTGLLVVTKRLDTGSPWPLSNNPRGRFFFTPPDGAIGNSDYPLWQVVRASTAAPSYFDPEWITIAELAGHAPVEGEFIDGGLSPFNNPAFQAFLYATIDGYRVGWPTGEDRLLLVSLGTGAADPTVEHSTFAATHAIGALRSLMDDCASLQETLLQLLSGSPTARPIDGEIGDLGDDLLAPVPQMSYVRYDVDLRRESVQRLLPELEDEKQIASLSEMDAPENLSVLHQLGLVHGQEAIAADHFPPVFDLPPLPSAEEMASAGRRRRYRKRPHLTAQAVQLDLATEGFSYEKWGSTQRCKAGDWLVYDDGETHTVDQDSFAATYRQVRPGIYRKIAPVWAEIAATAGSVETLEGRSHYAAGDYIVANREDGTDAYCVAAAQFERMYELDDAPAATAPSPRSDRRFDAPESTQAP